MQPFDDKAVQNVLMRRVWLRRVGAWLGILIALPLLFIAPLMLGTLLWFAYGNLFGWQPWTWFFLGTAGVAIPLLIRLEIRTKGNYLSEVAMDMPPNSARIGHVVPAVWPLMGMTGVTALRIGTEPRTASAGFIEIFLIGPRMLLPGVRHLRSANGLRSVAIHRAAAVVNRLLRSDTGMPIRKLLEPGERPEALGRTLHWLALYDWVGVAEKGDSVFLFSQSREKLGEMTASVS